MSSKHLSIEIIIDSESKSTAQKVDSISGKVVLTSLVDVRIESMNIYFYMEVKGKTSPEKRLLLAENLMNHSKHLTRNHSYEFPFNIVDPSGLSGYKGRNGGFLHKIEVGVDINPEDYSRVKPGILSSLKQLVLEDSSIKSFKYEHFEETIKNYSVETNKIYLKRNFIYWLALAFGLGIFPIIFFFIPSTKIQYIVMSVLASGLIGFLLQLAYLEFTPTEIIVQFENNADNTFSLKSHNFQDKQGRSPEFYYYIDEKVIDRRGTSSVTHTTNIYSSEVLSHGSSIRNTELKFDFPNRSNIPTIRFDNLEIKWKFCAKLKDTFGLPAVYEADFQVRRK